MLIDNSGRAWLWSSCLVNQAHHSRRRLQGAPTTKALPIRRLPNSDCLRRTLRIRPRRHIRQNQHPPPVSPPLPPRHRQKPTVHNNVLDSDLFNDRLPIYPLDHHAFRL